MGHYGVAPGAWRDDLLGKCPETIRTDLAFPDDDDTPAGLSQLALMRPVSLLRPFQLGLPVIRVALWDAAALLHEYPVGVGSRVVGRLWP